MFQNLENYITSCSCTSRRALMNNLRALDNGKSSELPEAQIYLPGTTFRELQWLGTSSSLSQTPSSFPETLENVGLQRIFSEIW